MSYSSNLGNSFVGINTLSGDITITGNLNVNGNINYSGDVKKDGFKLSSTWLAWGDSQTAGGGWGTPWPTYLAQLTTTNVTNGAVSGTTTDHLTAQNSLKNAIITSAAYNNLSSIIMYGFNDIRNNNQLYSNAYQYTQMLVGTYLSLSVPRTKIQDPRNWTKSGTWTNIPVYSFGVFTSTQGNYVENTNVTGRYYGFRFTGFGDNLTDDDWQISINGNFITELQKDVLSVQSGTYHVYGCVIDMGTSAPRTVRVTNNATTNTTNRFIDFIASWEENDPLARNVLVCSPPIMNYQYTGGAPWNDPSDLKRNVLVDCMKNAVTTLKRRGLPVYFHDTSIADSVISNDNIHLTSNAGETVARDILKYSISS